MKPNNHRDLLLIDAKSTGSYETLSLATLTAYSVHWLNRWEIPSTYENISVLNARLFPTKFSMAGFPEMPDAMATNRTLLQMRPKYRGFATSDPSKGVFLTERGRAEAARVQEAVGSPAISGRETEPADQVLKLTPKGKQRTRNPKQIIDESKGKVLYKRYVDGRFDETDIAHFLGLVSLYDHTPPSEVRKALRQLRNDAELAADTEFSRFLDEVERRFATYLNR